jgi:succinoglycan biosynthesis transport protein ExoP
MVDARAQVKQYIDVAWRRKWWVIAPALLGLAGAFYVAKTTQKMYRASTTILVVRQSVPQDLVRSTITMGIEERMKSLKVQVFSRRYLVQVAREFGMIKPGDSEATIERVYRHLSAGRVELDWDRQGFSWFRIIVDDESPVKAAGIANSLAKLFIEQNSEMREQQAKGTVDTIEAWRKGYEDRLDQWTEKIAKFKQEHLYELPEREGTTIQLLNAAQAQINQLANDIQAREDRLTVLQDAEKASRLAPSPGTAPIVTTADPDAVRLAQYQRELQDLLTNYTEANPLVKKQREKIDQFVADHPSLSSAHAMRDEDGTILSPEAARLQKEIKRLEADRDQQQALVDKYRQQLTDMPQIQQELDRMTRGYQGLQQEFDTATTEKERAKRAQDIENAKKGEQFTIQDKANPPAVPFKPQVLKLLLMGLAAGLGLGVGLALLLEFIDHTVKNEDEFASMYPDLPVLGAIPNLDRGAEHRRRQRRAKVESIAGGLVIATVASILGGMFGGLLR